MSDDQFFAALLGTSIVVGFWKFGTLIYETARDQAEDYRLYRQLMDGNVKYSGKTPAEAASDADLPESYGATLLELHGKPPVEAYKFWSSDRKWHGWLTEPSKELALIRFRKLHAL